MNDNAYRASPVALHDALSNKELGALRERIIESGALGRSPTYLSLLDYLLQAARQGQQPKEVTIAIEVMGRDASFDVSRDSIVRVYIHQLRKRLHKYYDRHEKDADFRLVIPKGQYTIAAQPHTDALSIEPEGGPHLPPIDRPPSPPTRLAGWPNLTVPLIILLMLNLIFLGYIVLRNPPLDGEQTTLHASHALWQNILNDDLPVLIVMGDYYIFGELDGQGRINRMVRDFNINSRDDLGNLFMRDNEARKRFLDLDMTYMPEGSAYALARVAPVLERGGKRVQITMMSRLSTADLRSNHIIYIGYISALDKLSNLYFSASGLQIGRSFDELYNRHSGEFYISDAGLPGQGQAFRDIALTATFPAANGNQFLLISGTRDAGLTQSAQVLTDTALLRGLEDALTGGSGQQRADSFEAVFEVYGLDRMHFDATLKYTKTLDPARVWRRQGH